MKREKRNTGEKREIALKNLFFRNGLRFIRGREYVDGSGLLQLTVLVCPILGTKKSLLVKECLEKYYEKAFYKGMEGSWLHPGENRLSFIEENGFHVLFGTEDVVIKRVRMYAEIRFRLRILDRKRGSDASFRWNGNREKGI
ncbi:MAG: hypothetical protein ACLTS6_18100 [Anaerobutyricum sp.]